MRRRSFLQGVGAAALAAPFFSMLRGTTAAAIERRAKYFFLFFTNGTDTAAWSPRGSTESEIAWSPMTEALAPLAGNLTIVEHLSGAGTADNHGAPGGLTGLGYAGQGHISVEQFIADRLRASGVATAIPSLLLGGVATEQQSTFWRGGQRLTPIFSPATAYETIFAGVAPGGGVDAALLGRRQSVLDLVGGELDALRADVGGSERAKLDLHTDSIRQLEERLSGAGAGGACDPGAAPSAAGQPLLDSALHVDLAVAALACDVTRVVAVEFGNHQSTQVSIPEVGAAGDWHNNFVHGDNPRQRLVALERWLCGQFVAAADKLKATPASDGDGTLFDQTLMLWARDMGDAVVHNGDMRFVFSGGAGGYLRTSPGGRYIDGGGDAHQRALVTCCDAMGITDSTGFGDPNAPRAPLAALAA